MVQFCPWFILYLTTEPQHKHVQNLEKATDLFQIINKVNINSLFVENILCLCQFLGCRGENQ